MRTARGPWDQVLDDRRSDGVYLRSWVIADNGSPKLTKSPRYWSYADWTAHRDALVRSAWWNLDNPIVRAAFNMAPA